MAEFFDTDPVTKGYDSQIARRIMSYLKPYKLYAFIALFALALSTAGELLTPTIIQRTVDNVLVREWYGVDPFHRELSAQGERFDRSCHRCTHLCCALLGSRASLKRKESN